jgi:ubiquinone/menaquinone biosynthesis C-methylase UbiE
MWLFESLKRRFAKQPVSANYRQVEDGLVEVVSHELRNSWQQASIPEKQRAIVIPQLKKYREGAPILVFDALVDILRANIAGLPDLRVLEVGCASGYYSEVFAIKGLGVSYEGCDYSPAFITLARQLYPGVPFDVQDATQLGYGDASFDIVVSGACILHIPEYERAITEAARVSRRWVVFHRTPVLHMHGPIIYTKKAYGVDTIEIHFNEQELTRLLSKHGMRVVDVNTHSIGWEASKSDALAIKTYLCEKIRANG